MDVLEELLDRQPLIHKSLRPLGTLTFAGFRSSAFGRPSTTTSTRQAELPPIPHHFDVGAS